MDIQEHLALSFFTSELMKANMKFAKEIMLNVKVDFEYFVTKLHDIYEEADILVAPFESEGYN